MEEKERKLIIALLIFIIFLIILSFIISKFGRIEVKIPTGYVDIFDINFINLGSNCKCTNNIECMCKEKQSSCNSKNCSLDKNDGIAVFDKEQEYSQKTEIKIFQHKSYYTMDGVIAPGNENAYQFIIRNNNNFSIIYNLAMIEINEHNINMKYRLKLNGKYILGNDENWIDTNELIQEEIILANNSYNVYTLEWKWFESENDTQIGTSIEANYKLSIDIFASEY